MLGIQELNQLSVREILRVCGFEAFTVPSKIRKNKLQLLELIISSAPSPVVSALTTLIQQRKNNHEITSHSKRKASEAQLDTHHTEKLARPRISYNYQPIPQRNEYQNTRFLDLPTSQETQHSYRQFYEATSNAAIRMTVCGVCAREVGWEEDQVTSHPIDQLPNAHRLIPTNPHDLHTLFDGKLLDPLGVTNKGNMQFVQICRQCRLSLQRATPNLPPPLSLANNMWIGQIPDVLSSLTFPEQLLISHLYPRVFVFKLYPKNGFGGDPDTLQRGMAGTVSTFDLDLSSITSMIEGNLMPRPLPLLASLISVTFIGLGRLPKHWLKQLFRVRRQKVHLALQWLKENNPKYYGQIEINSERLQALPINDIPVEILSIVRQSNDVDMIVQESAGYVPTESVDPPQDMQAGDYMDIGGCYICMQSELKVSLYYIFRIIRTR